VGTVTGAARDGSSSGPIFVVGSMRSGSTLLRLILDSHPNIAIGAETGFMAGLHAAREIPGWRYGKGWFGRLGWSEIDFDERLREFYSGLFQRYAQDQGKTRWGEKTPLHTEHIDEMARVFPDAVFVGIVRHPGAVASSLRKNFHYGFADAVGYWEQTNTEMVRAGSRLAERFMLCRYEDLVVEPELVLRAVMNHVGESWSPDLLQHHRVQRQKGAPRAAEGSTVTRTPIDSSRAAAWARGLDSGEVATLEAVADLARFFGYEALDPEPTTPVPGWSASVATGQDLAHRVVAVRGRVDFNHRHPPMPIDTDPTHLSARLHQVEQALDRTRSRRAVRLADAVRKVQHGRSPASVKAAWRLLRGGEHEA